MELDRQPQLTLQGNRKIYDCMFPDCGKSFSTSSNLTQHLLIHTDERPHVCDLCGRAFRQSGNLSKHKKSHANAHLRWDRNTSSKPFKCPEEGCEKSFTANNSLQNHMRKHTGEMPYACPFQDCSERFMLKTGLQTHLKIHEALLGQRSICLHSACRKSFKDDSELRMHIYVSYPGLVEECAALRASLAQVLRAFDADPSCAQMRNSALGLAVEGGRALLSMLPEEYRVRKAEELENSVDASCSSAEALDTQSAHEPGERIASAWRLHKEAAAEVATVVSVAKQEVLSSASGPSRRSEFQSALESGLSTLLMAAEGIQQEDPGSLPLGAKRKSYQDSIFTEKFFRGSSGGSLPVTSDPPSYI